MHKLAQELNRKVASEGKTSLFQKSAWITWEEQRRTKELAKALNVPLFKFISRRKYALRVSILSIRTVLILVRTRPKILFVQNPSIILATLACLLQRTFKYVLIVDRHSNFRIEKAPYRSVKEKLFQILSRYTIRKAHLTIVTNEFLKNLVEKWGGRGFVLQDRLPELDLAKRVELEGRQNIACIFSYSGDEPVKEVIEAAHLIAPSIVLHLTGDCRKLPPALIAAAPGNVKFTGFLDERAYQSLLFSSDAVMALTTADHFLLCGAYEAVSLGKPLILSDTRDLRDYFNKGCLYSKNDATSLASSIGAILMQIEHWENEILKLRQELADTWNDRFGLLTRKIEDFGCGNKSRTHRMQNCNWGSNP